jgi:hypothetical protein
VTDAARTARSMWTLFEPIHAVTYFAPEARAAFEEAGLRGFWRGYFAGRAAPLGPAGAAMVTASFFNFAPAFVARAIPAVWDLITPEDALRIRLAGAEAALRGLLAGREAEAEVAADLLWQAIAELDFSGRVLAAANAALPLPDGGSAEAAGGASLALARLWQAATLLREHRGDGHFAALAAADIDGCEAVALRCCLDLRREDLQPVRGWTDEAWDNALAGLADRGWVGADGQLTSAGQAAHDAVEDATDRAAARPWARLGAEATAELAGVLTPLAKACAATMPYPSPVGVPVPGGAGLSGAGQAARLRRSGRGPPGDWPGGGRLRQGHNSTATWVLTSRRDGRDTLWGCGAPPTGLGSFRPATRHAATRRAGDSRLPSANSSAPPG